MNYLSNKKINLNIIFLTLINKKYKKENFDDLQLNINKIYFNREIEIKTKQSFIEIINSNSYLNIVLIGKFETILKLSYFFNNLSNKNKKYIFIILEKYHEKGLIKEKLEKNNSNFNLLELSINNRDDYNKLNTFNFEDIILLFSSDLEEILNFIESIKFPSCNIFITPELFQILDKIKPFYDEIISLINKKKINIETAKKFGKRWIINILKNHKYYLTYPNVAILKNIGDKIPCLIIGAGNSLYKNIELIKKLKDKFIIISVDTAFRVLVKYKIYPDFVVSFDAQSINNSYILSIQNKISKDKLPICIVPPTINPIFLKKYKGVIIFTSIFFHPIPIFDKFKNKKCIELSSGGTVTSAAYDLAKLFNSPIKYLIGLDLAYTDNLLHSKNCLYEDIFYYFDNYKKTYIDIISKIMLKNSPFKFKNLKGEIVRTDVKFEMFSYWFSNYIDNKTYFLTNDVLFNEKFIYKNPENIIKYKFDRFSLQRKRHIKNLIKKIKIEYENIKKDKSTKVQLFDKEAYSNYIKKLKEELNQLKTLIENIIYLYQKIFEYKKNDLSIDSILLQLNFLEDKISNYQEGFKIINLTIQKEILDIEFCKFFDSEKFLYNSLNFYKNIYKSLDKILYILEN
ncbi:MAG: DUF115 domain-containing protein [Spirochaetes bacterium]|nr:DUF115 domain-containing protein [Spirochaetota bacterium]